MRSLKSQSVRGPGVIKFSATSEYRAFKLFGRIPASRSSCKTTIMPDNSTTVVMPTTNEKLLASFPASH
ncbi:uncharacterized protein BKA78DRAFT_327583 [Phyllosticta capitalensis]|uniref:uncharacterized protein n=1 Tax=Phyllosticta capitalensis TaxID=121624 RepID=UPI00312E2433